MSETNIIYSSSINNLKVEIKDTGVAYEVYVDSTLKEIVKVNDFDRGVKILPEFIAEIVAEEYNINHKLEEALKSVE